LRIRQRGAARRQLKRHLRHAPTQVGRGVQVGLGGAVFGRQVGIRLRGGADEVAVAIKRVFGRGGFCFQYAAAPDVPGYTCKTCDRWFL
jgi:hypothetical protein